MFCKKCGAQNAEGVNFCRNCGSPMTQSAPAKAGAGKVDYSNPFVLIPIIASAIALISVFLDWVGNQWLSFSLWGYIDLELDLISYLTTNGYLILFAGVLCIIMAIASIIMHALSKPKASIISFIGLVFGILWMIFFSNNTSGNSLKIGFFLYIICMGAAGACPIIAKKQGK